MSSLNGAEGEATREWANGLEPVATQPPADSAAAAVTSANGLVSEDALPPMDLRSGYQMLINTIEVQQEVIDQLLERVGDLEGKQANRPDGPKSIDWATLTGPERGTAWRRLVRFVEGLVYRYSLQREILPCWWQHGDAVEELTALFSARERAYDVSADAGQPVQWHEMLERTRGRVAGALSSCRDGHVPHVLAHWMAEDVRQQLNAAINREGATQGD
ncbi:hypothetical protein [Fodinicola feengrottensis]|uniref:Uncharacterized protein n=1 Tax=Fodinicola feengrottensis TaxID=435914 RepID=A0ABN2GC98_9ACTN|nr:hypothetical protein [Fodinicola feengrottensis]